ncbi:MAG TPA: hypothetical protein VGH98_13235 [Gemmatimonadaceae bacterium]
MRSPLYGEQRTPNGGGFERDVALLHPDACAFLLYSRAFLLYSRAFLLCSRAFVLYSLASLLDSLASLLDSFAFVLDSFASLRRRSHFSRDRESSLPDGC